MRTKKIKTDKKVFEVFIVPENFPSLCKDGGIMVLAKCQSEAEIAVCRGWMYGRWPGKKGFLTRQVLDGKKDVITDRDFLLEV
jgi:hypothetical protein